MEAAIFVYEFEKFVPDDLLAKIEKYKITTFCAPPTIYRFFIKEGMEGYDLSSLKYATVAGEALNPEVFNKFYQYTGLKLMEGFGQTETTLTVLNWIGMEPKPGSMGKPSPQYEVSIVDENCNPVPIGEVGEIVVCTKHNKPAGLFSCYYKDKEKTDAVLHDGYYHTGDTAWQDEDGYLWYVGRTDDVIKSSGYRIGPFEIESVLMEHPAVLECAVTGAPDPVRGQVVKATIVLMRGYAASDELADEIKNYVKHATAPYKYPRIVEFVSELPKTINGKIRRVEIREKSKQERN
jgi:acetyl-CoA synthetase